MKPVLDNEGVNGQRRGHFEDRCTGLASTTLWGTRSFTSVWCKLGPRYVTRCNDVEVALLLSNDCKDSEFVFG
jgi:hypothetical protein